MANQQQQIKGSAVGVAISHDDEKLCGAHVPFDFRDMQVSAAAGLGTRFRTALMKLEALMYAVYGAVPDYEGNLQWWTSSDVRCLWPEQLAYDVHTETGGNVEDYDYFQTSSRGEHGIAYPRFATTTISSTGYFDWGRSSTMVQQYHRTNHVAAWFPVGSVVLSGVDSYGDPQPDQDLTITWTVPEAKRNLIDSVKVVIAGTEYAMASGDGGITYTYTVSGSSLEHDDRTHSWYLKVVTDEEVPQTICDPYGASSSAAPDAFMPADTWDDDNAPGTDQNAQAKGDSYWFVPFTHVESPYKNGLPELLWQHYSGDKAAGLRKGTGAWQFEPWTNIRPGLINVARFCLDSLGEFFEQSPLLRGDAPGCCYKHPIRFRWTGGNRPWLYKPGGKTAAMITNLPDETNTGDATARLSWRGSPAPNLGLGFCPSNPMYGDDESWLPWPSTVPWVYRGDRNVISGHYTDEWAEGYATAKQYRGLREGDQIDRVHIEEIINAVDAIIDNGIWFIDRLPSCKRTPQVALPWAEKSGGGTPGYPAQEGVSDSGYYYNDWQGGWINYGAGCRKEIVGGYVDFAEPASIEDCRAGTGTNVEAGYCRFSVEWSAVQAYVIPGNDDYGDPAYTTNYYHRQFVTHDGSGSDPYPTNAVSQECYRRYDDYEDGPGSWSAPYDQGEHTIGSSSDGATNGWSYFLCGPQKNVGGPGTDRWADNSQRWDHEDALHGNGFHKNRGPSYGYAYDDGTEDGKYQYVASLGNCADQAWKCTGGDDVLELSGWNQVEAIHDQGPTAVWATPRTTPFVVCGGALGYSGMPSLENTLPPLPGLGYYDPPGTDGERRFMCSHSETTDETWWDGHLVYDSLLQIRGCSRGADTNYPNCTVDSNQHFPVYMRVDLNLDEDGVPELYDYDLSIYQIGNSSVHPDTPYDTDLQTYQTGGKPYDCSVAASSVLIAAGGVQCPRGTDCGCV